MAEWLNGLSSKCYGYINDGKTLRVRVPFPSRCEWGTIYLSDKLQRRECSNGYMNVCLPKDKCKIKFDNGDVEEWESARVRQAYESNKEDLAAIREAMKDPLTAAKQYPSLSKFMADQLSDETVSDMAQYYNDLQDEVCGKE